MSTEDNNNIEKLNEQLKQMGLSPIKDVDNTPERTRYYRHLAIPVSERKKNWSGVKKILKQEYADNFHKYIADRYPYLLYEVGEDKVYWLYNEEVGIYEELSVVSVKTLVSELLEKEDLIEKATDSFIRNCLLRYRGKNQDKAHHYNDFDSERDWFHAKNGWLNLMTGEFKKHSPERLSRRVSAVSYDKDATCPRYDSFLDGEAKLKADEIRVIDQFSGLLLTPDVKYEKMLTLIGRSGSGKSTLLNIWSYILGDLATQKRLTDLSGESFRFAGASLVGKTLCWFDEVDVKRSEMGNSLGTLITGEKISVERKGINGIIQANNQLKCVLTANSLPLSSEHGMFRRLILIHFTRSFYEEMAVDNNIGDKLKAEASGILNRMVKGLHDLRKLNGFAVISGHDELIEEYKESSDVIAEFLGTYFVPVAVKDAEPIETSQLFNAYIHFIGERRGMTLTPQRFGKLLSAQPLQRFNKIASVRDMHSRYWTGLKLKKGLKFDSDNKIVETFEVGTNPLDQF